MQANHPHLTTQKSFYVEISRARYRAELVTDDAKALRERLETATGERVSALEGIGEAAREAPEGEKAKSGEAPRPVEPRTQEPEKAPGMEKVRTARGIEMDM